MSTYYDPFKVHAAMRDLYDIGERIMLRPIVLGEVARQIVDNQDIFFDLQLEVGKDEIEWLLPEANNIRELQSLFKTWGFIPNEKGYHYEFERIPVQIRVVKKHYAFFKNPDMKFYKTDEFFIPNPFEKYWKSRFFIK